jgi:RNA polymerase sigma-70 factor (ECF subfamily)
MNELNQQNLREHFEKISLYDSHVDFQIVYNHYYNKLFRQALYYFRDSDVAQEIVVDVFMALWQTRKTIGKVENPDAYLFIALKHARAKHIEHHYKRRQELFIDQIPDIIVDNSSDSNLLETEAQEKYRAALEKLPPRCAEVFRLVREEKKKYAEAADILNISVKTVDNQMNKAVKILYSELKNYLFSIFF